MRISGAMDMLLAPTSSDSPDSDPTPVGTTAVITEDALNIYTDGSSFGGPRRGGVGMLFVLIDDSGNEQSHEFCPPGYRGATNNQMELKACVLALREASRLRLTDAVSKIVIHTDSMYVSENVNRAKFEWPKTKWCRRGGAPVANTELWKDLIKAIKAAGKPVHFEWVKGHSKDLNNRKVDKLAKSSARTALNPPLTIVNVRRKLSSEIVALGSVGMLGQRLTIRVITSEYLRTHRVWKLKYEVMSKRSPYYSKIDVIYSEPMLSAGHQYRVRVNSDPKHPRIEKLFSEVEH